MSGERRKSSPKSTRANISRISWDATSSLDILMDDSSPPSSVTSSNYITGSNGEIDSSDDKSVVDNAWVSSTTKGSFLPAMSDVNIKKEPCAVNSTRCLVDENMKIHNSGQLSNNELFDEEDSLEEFDEDDIKTQGPSIDSNQASSLTPDIKPNRIYLAKPTKSPSMPSINKNVIFGGKGITSVTSEAANFSTISYSKPGLNGIEFPLSSSARTILKLPNPLTTSSNGTLILHHPARSFNGTPAGKPNIVPPITVKPNVEALHLKRPIGSNGTKSIICHSKSNSSHNPQWLSSNNTNIKIRSPMTVVNTALSKFPLNKKRPFSDDAPKHYDIRPGVTNSNVLLSENKTTSNKNASPSLAKKPTVSSGKPV